MPNSGYRKIDFALIDVFADEPLRGNPLAVVDDGSGLDDPTMRRLALEFNQAETTFILPPTNGAAHHRLRSFTATGTEVFGAGHNALGAWWRLAATGRLGRLSDTGEFRQEIGEEILPVIVKSQAGILVSIEMKQSSPHFGTRVEGDEALAAALGLDVGEIVSTNVPAQVVSTGTPHLMVPLSSRAAVDGADPNAPELRRYLLRVGAEGCYIFSFDPTAEGAIAYARFFNPVAGIREDPATGTAAGPLVSHLVQHRVIADGTAAVVQQGVAMGRESLLHVSVSGEDVRLSGSCFTSGEGVILA
jgi:trans-2,3-dihydro-3-hydroxyanthranilate isomerase